MAGWESEPSIKAIKTRQADTRSLGATTVISGLERRGDRAHRDRQTPAEPLPEPARGSPGTRHCCCQHRALVSPSFGTEIRARQSHRGGSCSVPAEDSGEGWIQLLPGVWGCSSSSIPGDCLPRAAQGEADFQRGLSGAPRLEEGACREPPERPVTTAACLNRFP